MAARKGVTGAGRSGRARRRSRPAPAIGRRRFAEIARALEEMIDGDLQRQLPISSAQDEVDAICYSINILVGELAFTSASLRRAQAEAEAASEAKSSFLRTASHELRTPLAVIVWLAEAVKDPTAIAPDRLARALAGIRSSAKDLLRTTEAVLDLSRLEELQAPPAREATDLPATIAEALENLRPLADQKQIGLRLIVEPGAPPVLMTHAQQVRQVVVNLVANAIKFTASGEIRVRVQRMTAQVAIDVEDSGVGIPPEARPRIFEPFFQVDPKVSQRLGGTGLGLALARRLAERLGGELSLHATREDQGSIFRLALPLAVPPGAGEATAQRAVGREGGSLDGLHILVADDEELMREALANVLEAQGATVSWAANGDEAMEKALAGKFDLVLMDVRMPILDGLSATRRLRAGGYQQPVIALTAGASTDQRTACLAAGCDDRITKPVATAELVAKIAAVCRAPGAPMRRREESL